MINNLPCALRLATAISMLAITLTMGLGFNDTANAQVTEVPNVIEVPAIENPPAAKPNIIWILADDLGYNDLGCMGQTGFSTPHLDQMAAEGMKFTQFYAGCTVCAPSRACMLTGQHTGHIYQRFNGMVQFREDPQDVTIANLLKQAGYRTGMIGKSALSCNSFDRSLPNRKGFDHFYGVVSHVAAHRYYPREMIRNGKAEKIAGNEGFEGKQYSSDLFVEDALKFVAEDKGKPFFLHLALQQPHADLQVPEEYLDGVGPFDEKAHKNSFYRSVQKPKSTFVGMMKHLDESVGKILNRLRELGLDKNTLVIFSSDNGPHYEGGHHPENFDSNGPLRGGKRDLYEGGIRVPMLAWWPDKIPAGSTSELISAFWDLPVTACEIANCGSLPAADGVSLLPTLTGSGTQQQHEYLYWEFYEMNGRQAIRMDNWKAVRLNVKDKPNGPLQLFDLSTDIGEQNDVAKQQPEVIRVLTEKMKQAHVPSKFVSFANGSSIPLPIAKRIEGGKLLDRSEWKISASSGQSKKHRGIPKAIDGKPKSLWNAWGDGPHWFVIDFGKSVPVTGVRLLPRQDGKANGMIDACEIFLSDDETFAQPVTTGRLETSLDEQRIAIEKRSARYMKVVVTRDTFGRKMASLAEINVETE